MPRLGQAGQDHFSIVSPYPIRNIFSLGADLVSAKTKILMCPCAAKTKTFISLRQDQRLIFFVKTKMDIFQPRPEHLSFWPRPKSLSFSGKVCAPRLGQAGQDHLYLSMPRLKNLSLCAKTKIFMCYKKFIQRGLQRDP